MKGLQEIRFMDRDYVHGTVVLTVKDDNSSYAASIDVDALIYALQMDLGLEVEE